MRKVVIVGSSRNDGDTSKLADILEQNYSCDVVNLSDYKIGYYDYDHKNRSDDFLPFITRILESYDTLIFATPVYWYSMSGIMKVFFDRITDLLTIEKELGRKLRGKHMAVVSSSNGSNLGDQFWLPFIESAKYLGMDYLGNVHTISGEPKEQLLEKFMKQIASYEY